MRPGEPVREEDIVDFFQTANLSSKQTGLPFVLWISPEAGALHDVRVKVSRGPKVISSELISVAIRPDIRVIDDEYISAQDLALLRQWVDLNHDVIVEFWDGGIEYTADAIAALKPIR